MMGVSAIYGTSMMIGFILLVRLAALKYLPKRIFRLLWVIVGVRLLLPVSLTVEVESTAAIRSPTQAGMLMQPTEAGTVLPAEPADPLTALLIPPETVLTVLWLLGSICLAGFFLHAYARLHRLAHRAEVQTVCGERVHVGDGFASPFSCGVVKPVIFLPTDMLTLDDGMLSHIVAHERQHIRCGDQLVKWLLTAAVCVHWYNPLVWMMFVFAGRDLELACDEAVVARTADPAAYALCLIAAEEIRSAAPINSFGAPAIRERIECIMKTKKLTVCGFIAAALMLAAMTPFFIEVEAVEKKQENVDETVQTAVSDDTAQTTAAADETADVSDAAALPVAFCKPLGDYVITRGFDAAHPAVDLAAAKGSSIFAAADGEVILAEYDYTNGNHIKIRHTDGSEALYAHCETLTVSVGDSVRAGDVIATVGETGAATGPHLHFALTADGEAVLPALFEAELANLPKRPF